MHTQLGRTRNGILALATADRSESGTRWLTPAEELMAAERDENRRADWVAGRLAAKRAVVAILAAAGAVVPLRSVEIRSARSGAPRPVVLPGGHHAGALFARARGGGSHRQAPAPTLALSLAHRDGRALAAAAVGGRVGVDLERSWSVHPAAVRYFGPPVERITFARNGAEPTGLWALREAAWKALECASDLPFHSLRLELDAAGRPLGVGRAAPGVGPASLLPADGRVWRPWPGYLGAVVLVPPKRPSGALR